MLDGKEKQAGESPATVRVNVPKKITLTNEHGAIRVFNPGDHEVDPAIADHWWMKANGATTLEISPATEKQAKPPKVDKPEKEPKVSLPPVKDSGDDKAPPAPDVKAPPAAPWAPGKK